MSLSLNRFFDSVLFYPSRSVSLTDSCSTAGGLAQMLA